MMGAHVLRAGVNRHIIDLMERGIIDHIAMNGAGAIHDYELARIGATTESVARYINERRVRIVARNRRAERMDRARPRDQQLGLGENVGRRIEASEYPYRELSVFAAAWRTCAGHRPRGHRIRHPARASELRRRGAGRGELSRLPDLRAHSGALEGGVVSASARRSWLRRFT